MGNQLTGIAPSQILPVEHYLTEEADYEYDSSLGSTRFFKVARAKYKEGLVVVKVFVIHDPSLPLKTYYDEIRTIKGRLSLSTNCLPFQRATVSDKAVLLFRQYVKDSLYDRISTRPFLNTEEKKWIAFQLLCALNQAHKLQVCHGDIKSENVMVTSWNWVLLTDFASFKPAYLPEDNPADFSYFFDTSRRRTCYIAPERFVESTLSKMDTPGTQANIDLTATSDIQKGDLTPVMDIFSAGCVITELFTEGNAPFDLSQLLAYRIGEYSPWKILEKIEDQHVRMLVRNMLQKDPNSRLSAEEYLIQQRGKAFPEYFYTFAKLYTQRFASMPIMTADDRVLRIKKDLEHIEQNLNVKDGSENSALVLVITILTASLRYLRYCSSKLVALELMLHFSKFVSSDIILDRLVPYVLFFVNDNYARVRAEAVKVVSEILVNVKDVPRSDANIFPEYILPSLSHISQDPVVAVRVAYAQNIALMAETALRFLELIQLNDNTEEEKSLPETQEEKEEYESSYDIELQTLHETIQQKAVTLLCDSANIVKQTMLENGITRLCVFFGRQKANDILLSHMITFLNDKYDWHLRGSFFDSIVGVAAYVGWQSSSILKPLLQQGLSDPEDFVIHKTLKAITSLTELGLLQKPIIHEMLREVVPFLCHPGVWIRQGAVGVICAVAKKLNIADVHCNLLPVVQPFLKHTIIQVEKEVVVLNALQNPIPRPIYDYILKSPLIEKLFDCLQDRQLIRNKVTRPGHKPAYSDMDEGLSQLFRKLTSQGMVESDEDKLLALKDVMLKLHRTRVSTSESSSSSSFEDDAPKNGSLDISTLGSSVTRRHADMVKSDSKADTSLTTSRRKHKKAGGTDGSAPVNEEWKTMFGSTEENSRSSSPKSKPKHENVESISYTGSKVVAPIGTLTSSTSTVVTSGGSGTMSQLQSSVDATRQLTMKREQSPVQSRIAPCKIELRNLVYEKREQFSSDCAVKDLLDTATWENRPPPANWRPKGILVAHLHEHRGAVNRVQVSDDHHFFATCSNDGCVKVWDSTRFEGKSVTNRSRQTYNKQGGQIKTIAFCENDNSIAAASDNGSLHVFRIETETNRVNIKYTEHVDLGEHGTVVDIRQFDTGPQCLLVYATVHGHLVGWDLRTARNAWVLKNDPKHGLITSFDVHHAQCWMTLGTSSGTFVCWDMRFQLPISTITHPTGARVRRVVVHPREQSWIISSVQGNNEISMWDMETSSRQKTLWASTAPALSQTQASNHSVNGIYYGATDSNTFLLTAGSDMRVRYWDLNDPIKSYIAAGAASDPVNQQTTVSYKSKLIDGTEVIQETYGKAAKSVSSEDVPRRGPESPPQGHHDVITDINTYQTTQCFMVTSSRDGVVKVWK